MFSGHAACVSRAILFLSVSFPSGQPVVVSVSGQNTYNDGGSGSPVGPGRSYFQFYGTEALLPESENKCWHPEPDPCRYPLAAGCPLVFFAVARIRGIFYLCVKLISNLTGPYIGRIT